MNNPDAAIAFLRNLDLPYWHVRRPDMIAVALFPDLQGERTLRSMLTERDACNAVFSWLPAQHHTPSWPIATPASHFPWAIINAPASQEQRGPMHTYLIHHNERHWRLHSVRPLAHAEVMEQGHIIAAQIPLATAWDPLAGVPLPGSGGAYAVE